MRNSKVSAQAPPTTSQSVVASRTHSTRRASSPNLLLSALLTTGGATLLVGGVLLGHAPQNAPAAASSVLSAPATGAAPAAAVPYTASKFPGVMVRNVPAAVTQPSGQKAWLYVKPGAKRTSLKGRYGSRSGHVWYEAGKTTAGGTIAHVDPSFYPASVAKVKHDGKGQHVVIAY